MAKAEVPIVKPEESFCVKKENASVDVFRSGRCTRSSELQQVRPTVIRIFFFYLCGSYRSGSLICVSISYHKV